MTSLTKLARPCVFILVLMGVSGFSECYKPITKSELPGHIHTVAVPAFQNTALRYKIEERFTQAVMQTIIKKGRGLKVQSEREGADAVVDGVIKECNFTGVLLDNTGRARLYEVTIVAAVTIRDQVQNRVLYDNQHYVFRGEFEFANDPRSYFYEEDPAVMRIANSFAESLVSTLVNGFGVTEEK